MLDTVDSDLGARRLLPCARVTDDRKPISREVVSGCIQFADFGVILLAGKVAFSDHLVAIFGTPVDFDRYSLTTVMAAVIFVFTASKTSGYSFPRLGQLRWQGRQVTLVWIATASMMSMAAFLSKVADSYSRGWAITFVALSLTGISLIRIAVHFLVRRWKRQGRLTRLIGIIGAGDLGEQVISKLKRAGENELRIAGVFDDRLSRVPAVVGGCQVLGTTHDLVSFAQTFRLDEIIIAMPLQATARIMELVERVRSLPADIRLSIDPLAGAVPMRGIGETASVPVLSILDRPLKNWNGIIKMLEDKVLAAILLVPLLPLMGLIALAIRLDSKGPALFIQDRFGFNNSRMQVLKFRTMHVEKGDPSGARRTVRGDPRVTRIGRILRSSSLDELPQLINVLRGEMSLVGPRAHAMAMRAGGHLYHEAVSDYFQRHKVRPGITGWAQVNGLRGEIDCIESARKRVAYDLYYIDHWSLWLDLKILLMTARTLWSGQNAY